MTVYDIHAHCIPQTLLDLLERDGARYGIEMIDTERGRSAVLNGRETIGPFRPFLTDMDHRLAAMDTAGIDVQVLSSWIDLTAYALDPDLGAAYARRVNEVIAGEADRHPDRFLAIGTVPLQAPEAAAEELRCAVEEFGMIGVEIATTVDGADLDRAGLEPFWETAAALRCMVVVHPMAALTAMDLRRNFLDNTVGRPVETTVAVAAMMFDGVFDRHPELVVCAVHGGGFIPYQLGRMQRGFTAVPHLAAERMKTAPAEVARMLHYDTVLHSPTALRFLIDTVGADRVVLGTDHPFEMGDTDPVATVEAVPGITADERGLILEENVVRILSAMHRPGGAE